MNCVCQISQEKVLPFGPSSLKLQLCITNFSSAYTYAIFSFQEGLGKNSFYLLTIKAGIAGTYLLFMEIIVQLIPA